MKFLITAYSFFRVKVINIIIELLISLLKYINFFKYHLKKTINIFIKTFVYRKYRFQDPRILWNNFFSNFLTIKFNKSHQLFFGNEFRHCKLLKNNNSEIIKFRPSQCIKIGIYNNSIIKNNKKAPIEFFSKNNLIGQASYINNNVWHEFFFDNLRSDLTIKNKSKKNFYTSLSYLKKNNTNQIKNIIFLLYDSLDNITLNAANLTPNINKFFSKGVNFKNCFSTCEWTFPWLHSFLVNEYPCRHNMNDTRNSYKFRTKTDNLFKSIKQKNFFITGAGTKTLYNTEWQNIKFFDSFTPLDGAFDKNFSSLKAVENIINTLEVSKNNNFFYYHLMDSHYPWVNKGFYEQKKFGNFRICDSEFLNNNFIDYGDTKAEPIYDKKSLNELRKSTSLRLKKIDNELAYLFNYLRQNKFDQNTAVILTSDHGYRYHPNHKHLLSYQKTKVPLFVFLPGYKKMHLNLNLINNTTHLNQLIKFIINKKNINKNLDSYLNNKLKQDYLISESIYDNKYKATVRSRKLSLHFSCYYNPIKNKINFNNQHYVRLYNFDETKIIKSEKYKQLLLLKLKDHLKNEAREKIN